MKVKPVGWGDDGLDSEGGKEESAGVGGASVLGTSGRRAAWGRLGLEDWRENPQGMGDSVLDSW
jgi:hypothetical protein